MWQLAITGLGLLGGAKTAKIQANAQIKAAEESTKQAKAKQEDLNAQTELARNIQVINNRRIMNAADKTYAAASENLQRNRAARTTHKILREVAQAEAAGAYAANTASKNIGGSSADAIASTMALRDSLQDALHERADSQADYDAVQTLAGIIPAAWQQQDMTVITGNSSAAAAVPQVQGGFNYMSALAGSKDLTSLLSNWTSGLGKSSTGMIGAGLKLPGSDVGLSAPSTGFFSVGSFLP